MSRRLPFQRSNLAVRTALIPPSSPETWWDARAVVGVADGGNLTAWPNGGTEGATRNLAIPSLHLPPLWRATTGPLATACVDFDGVVNAAMQTAAFSSQATAVETIAALVRMTSVAAANTGVVNDDSSFEDRLGLQSTFSTVRLNRSLSIISTATYSLNTWSYFVGYQNGASSSLNVNGTTKTGDVGSGSARTSWIVGQLATLLVASQHPGQIAEVIVWRGRDVRTEAETYCRQRLGL